MTPLFAQALKEAFIFSLIFMSPAVLYVAASLIRGIVDDVRKLVWSVRHAER